MSRYIDAELLIEAMQGRKFANDECVRHATDSPSKEYYRHLQFEDGIMMDFVREQPTAEVIPLDLIREAREEVAKYQSIHDSYCEHIENGDYWEGHTPSHYESSGGKATACAYFLRILDNLIAEMEG